MRGMRGNVRRAFRNRDFNPAVGGLLHALSHQEGQTIAELSRGTGLVKSHVSKTVDQMVADGVVEKRPDPSDQRLVRIFLTGTAERHHKEIEARMEEIWLEIVARVPEAELPVVTQGIQALLRAVRPADAGDPAGRSPC